MDSKPRLGRNILFFCILRGVIFGIFWKTFYEIFLNTFWYFFKFFGIFYENSFNFLSVSLNFLIYFWFFWNLLKHLWFFWNYFDCLEISFIFSFFWKFLWNLFDFSKKRLKCIVLCTLSAPEIHQCIHIFLFYCSYSNSFFPDEPPSPNKLFLFSYFGGEQQSEIDGGL